MKIQQYFNKNSGIFTALAIFVTFMILSEKNLFLSFAGFFISFTLISYLLNEVGIIEDIWSSLLFIGYNILFIAMILYGINKYQSFFKGYWLTIILVIIVVFYAIVNIKFLYKTIKNSVK